MFQDLDEFSKLMNKVEANSPVAPKTPKSESVLDLADYNMDPVHEGIIQNGINRVSNLFSANIKSKISNEWKHLDEDERKLLLRIIAGDSALFSEENSNVDVALARAFKEKTLTPSKTEDGGAGIVINRDVDLSNSGANSFPNISVVEVTGDLKCSYSSFSSFANFPLKAKSIELVKGKAPIENLSGIPSTTGKNASNYAVDLKYTKVNSLKGWKPTQTVKGHVSFRGCDLKDISVDGQILISGILDLRDNPNISVESLKAILLKDHSKNQIIAKGGIYHTLESDGFYSANKIKNDGFVNEDLGQLTEARTPVNKAGVLVPQEELWRIGPEIIRQAEAKKGKKQAGSAKDNLQSKITPEVQNLVSNMASSQMDRNAVTQASQKIVSGMSSDEFRTLMKGLFDNLLKQLTAMMNSNGTMDSSQIDKSVETISKVAAEDVADKVEEFARQLDEEIKSGNCLDSNKLNSDLIELLKTVPEVGSADLKVLQKKAEALTRATEDRAQYSTSLGELLNVLYVDILGKTAVSEGSISKILDSCFGEEDANATEDNSATATSSTETSSSPTPSSQEEIPEIPSEQDAQQAPAPAPTPAPQAPKAPAAQAPAPKAPASAPKAPAQSQSKVTQNPPKPASSSLLANASAKKAEIPSQVTASLGNSKSAKGLNRFQKIIGSGSAKGKIGG